MDYPKKRGFAKEVSVAILIVIECILLGYLAMIFIKDVPYWHLLVFYLFSMVYLILSDIEKTPNQPSDAKLEADSKSHFPNRFHV